MTQAHFRLLGNVVLGMGIIVLLVTLSGMFGLIPKLARSNELVLLSAALVIGSRGLRRRGRLPPP